MIYTVFPQIRPAGIIFSLGLQLRVSLEITKLHLHKRVSGNGIIRNVGIIRPLWNVEYLLTFSQQRCWLCSIGMGSSISDVGNFFVPDFLSLPSIFLQNFQEGFHADMDILSPKVDHKVAFF